jgi:hypothetical protein
MTCRATIVYWQASGTAPCDYCLDSEGYYMLDDCPAPHDLCQCVLSAIDVPEELIEFEDFAVELWDEWEIVVDHISPGTDEAFTFAGETVLFGEVEDNYSENFDDECFRDHCEATSGSEWELYGDLESSMPKIPPGYGWAGEITLHGEVLGYSATASALIDDGESSTVTPLGPVDGWVEHVVDWEFEGDLYERTWWDDLGFERRHPPE